MVTRTFSQTPRNYSKYNYVEAVELITPNIYFDEDIDLSGTTVNILSQVINSHLNALESISSVIFVSALDGTNIYSAIDASTGFAPFLVKQNNLTKITPKNFEEKILVPLGKSFKNFNTSAEFSTYLDSFLSSIVLNTPTATFTGISTNSSAVHEYLIRHLSWVYFLNTSGDGGFSVSPSSITKDLLINTLYRGQPIFLNDAMKAYSDVIFQNYETCTAWQTLGLIPNDFLPSGLLATSSTYTSGLEQLSKLQTLIDVIYSPLKIDEGDTRVKDAIDDFINNSLTLIDRNSAGPFFKLLRAFSFAFADSTNTVETLETLNDIQECPDELLPELARLIGWSLYGHDPSRWRLQLYNAVDLYKRAGTKESVQIAVNSVFTKDTFDVSGKITELWESYIPHLIYYALATESSFFKDRTVWTASLANRMGVSGHSDTNMDDNIRTAVDAILLRLQKLFPEVFLLAGKQFPVGSPSFVFNFRGRDFPIPPWEEIPYYMNGILHERFIAKLADELACFGVRQTFALEVATYVRENTLLATDDIRSTNKWLFFTSGINYPTNWDIILADISTKRTDFLSLWSGKSSHYKLILEASSFDFSKSTVEFDSKLAPSIIIRAADEFSPAHAIKDAVLVLGEEDTFSFSSTLFSYFGFNKLEETLDLPASSMFKNRALYGASMPGLFSREETDEISDSLMDNVNSLIVPRNSFRRRNYRYLLPKDGYYDRTGFNAPVSWDPSSLENSLPSSLGYLPLGYIPSAGKFHAIPDHINLPDVYTKCQVLSVSDTFSGVDVSNTFPSRGLSALGSNAKYPEFPEATDRYVDRGQLDPIMALMHNMEEQRKFLIGVSSVSALFDQFIDDFKWKNLEQSWANSATNLSGAFPTSFKDYENFEFSRGIHQLYKDYTKFFNRHHTRGEILDLEGPTILAHAFGSILRNSKFDKYGSVFESFPVVVASSTATASALGNGEGIFDTTLTGTFNSTLHNTNADVIVSSFGASGEIRNKHVLSGVDFIQLSGTSPLNSFTVYNIDRTQAKATHPNFTINNPLVKLKAIDGLPRMKYSIKNANPLAEGFSTTENFLIPEHDMKLTVRYSGGTADGKTVGGVNLGVWIHTDHEDGIIWSLNSQKEWEIIKVEEISRELILSRFTQVSRLKKKTRTTGEKKDNPFLCLDQLEDEVRITDSFIKEDFIDFDIEFSTRNKHIVVPESYYRFHNKLHRTTQNYIIEVFMFPNTQNIDKFVLLDHLNLVDMTNNLRTKPPVYGTETGLSIEPLCDLRRIELSREQILTILRFFNKLSGATFRRALASRDAIQTSSILEVSGGSRLNYRQNYKWPNHDITEASSLVSLKTFETLIVDI